MMLPAFVHRLPWSRRADVRATLHALTEAARRDPRLTLWRAATVPLWVASDIPVPDRPSRTPASWGALATVTSGPGRDVRDMLATLLRRYRWSWSLTAILRGLALGLWIALVWTLIALATDVGMPNRWWVGGLMLAGLLVGIAFGVLNRPTPLRLALSLDQTFGLNERLTTALDPALTDPDAPSMRLQLADTANTLAEVRSEFPVGAFIPFREVFVALIAGMLLLAAFFANVPGGDLPPAASGAVPPFAPAADRLAVEQTPPPSTDQQALPQEPEAPDAEMLEQAETSNQTRLDLEALGSALSDYALTQPASESIAEGDYDQAADDLREAAANVDSLSPEAREALADDLDEAASQMSPANPNLADASRQTAESLRGDEGDAGEQLNELAGEVERAGEKVAPNSEIAAGPPDSSTSAPQSSASTSEGAESTGQQSGAPGESPEGAPAEAGDPGSGAAAQAGLSNREIDAENQASSQGGESGGEQGGTAGQAASDAPSEAGTSEGAPGASGGQSGSEQPGEESGGASGGSEQQTADPADASQGAGAGGEGDTETAEGQEQQGGGGEEPAQDRPEADTSQQGQADDAPPSGGEAGETGEAAAPSGRDQLVLEGTSDENIPSGTNVGTSSLGSGSGASAASGNAAPVAVGEAGPDSNRVPPEYREYVENYFNRDRP